MSMRVLTEITIRLRCGAICVIRPVNPHLPFYYWTISLWIKHGGLTQWTTVNMLHYTFVENTFGCMSQAPCYFRLCQAPVPAKIKAVWCIGSNSWGVKLCQRSKGNHQRLFSVRSTAGWRDRQGLIVYQMEAEEILSLRVTFLCT